MIPRIKPDLGWQELLAAMRFSRRDDVADFEQAFARYADQKHAIAFPYGRTAIMLLLQAFGLQEKEVICPAYTCVVVPHAIVYSGNSPVFVDSQPSDFNMDLELAENVIGENTGAIIATSIFGYAVDVEAIEAIRRRHPQLRIIQDCCHSYFAAWQGKPVHKFGDAAVFALNASKFMTSIFGGMVTTDSDDLAETLRNLRSERLEEATRSKSLRRFLYLVALYPAFWTPVYSVVHYLQRSGWLDRFVRYYDPGRIDMPVDYIEQMTALEARVGQVQLKKLSTIVRERKEKVDWWREYLAVDKQMSLPPDEPGATYSHFVCQVDDRDALMAHWEKRGVELGRIIEYCIPEMPAYREYSRGLDYPVASSLAKRVVNFPISAFRSKLLAAIGAQETPSEMIPGAR